MGKRRAARERRRAREFEAFVAGAGGRLLPAAALLTGEPPEDCAAAERLLEAALAGTYAHWDELRGDDPYDRTRRELAVRFARTAWRHRHRHPAAAPAGGLLAALAPRERLVLVLRLYEGVAEEVTAAALGLPADRVRALYAHAIATLRAQAREGDGTAGAGGLPPGPPGGAPSGAPAASPSASAPPRDLPPGGPPYGGTRS
ncbi:sigma factor-like helix-turn-helix DNA-binding protein [Streptomyces sp. 796.1]|uniref:sigma factor-like helix-turn-helix DNA-binding protein n=1 Tax=Streptomyces sp. 796.1 TaxID=3163029 RepID=UPI0039C92620